MQIPEDVLEKKRQEFLLLKKYIIDNLRFENPTDDEIKEELERLISLQSELFDNSMNDLVLRKYYNYFLSYIYPKIYNMEFANKQSGSVNFDVRLHDERTKINFLNQNALDSSLNSYLYSVSDGYLVNTMNSHEVLLSEDLENLLKKKDVFQEESSLTAAYTSKHKEVKYKHDLEKWYEEIEKIKEKLNVVEQRLNEKIPDFEFELKEYENLIKLYKEYENLIKLYKEYIRKYRFISSLDEVNTKQR